jgi:hypothetical protein
MTNIEELINLVNKMIDKLGISEEHKKKIIEIVNSKKDTFQQNISPELIVTVERLLVPVDENLNKFGEEKLANLDKAYDSFKKLKDSLAELQVRVIIKKIEKSKDCDEILTAFIGLLNDKVNAVNQVLQLGGTNNIYKHKYFKYKYKYIKLINDNIG